MPWRLVVMNGWNSCSAISGAMPEPVSATLTRTCVLPGRCDRDRQLAGLRRLHRVHGVADQIEQHLLDLHAVGQHQIDRGSKWNCTRMPRSLTPTSASALASSTSLVMLSTRRSLSPRETKSRSRRMIWPARIAWSAALSERVAQRRRALVAVALQQPPRALQVIRDRRQRLVELVRERRGHLAHGGEARDVHELGLQFLQARLGLLPLGQVADEAGEEALRRRISSRRPRAPSERSSRPCAGRPPRGRCR